MDEIELLFAKQRVASEEFAREMFKLLYEKSRVMPKSAAQINLKVARMVFSKWSIEILTVLYSSKSMGFGELKRSLPGINSRVLSEKLKKLEAAGLVSRRVADGRPPRTFYQLKEDGVTLAKLGEPVFLFLGYREGLLSGGEPIPVEKELLSELPVDS